MKVTATTLVGGASVAISPDAYQCDVDPPTTINVIPTDAGWRLFPAEMSGGLRGGDTIHIDIHLAPGSRALWTPPASTQVFPGHGSELPVFVDYSVALDSGSRLIAMNQATIPCFGAQLIQTTDLQLAFDCELLWFDVWSSGREAFGERWLFDRIKNSFCLTMGERSIYRERWTLRSDSIPGGVAGFSGFGTMWTVILRRGNPGWDPRRSISDRLESMGGIAEWGDLGDGFQILKGLTPPGYSALPSIEDLL